MTIKTENKQKAVEIRPRRFRPWLPLILFLILAVPSALFHFEKNRWHERALSAGQQLKLAAGAAPIADAKRLRSRFYETSYYFGHAWKSSFAVADLVRRLSGIVRKPLQAIDLKVVPGWQDLKFELSLVITADKEMAARGIFAEFYPDMQDLIEASQMTFSEPMPAVLSPGRAAVGYVFTISGQVETE
jgi:hypothetical protein